MAYTLILVALMSLLSVVCYLKVLYEWHRKVRVQTVKSSRYAKKLQKLEESQPQEVEEAPAEFPQAPGPYPWPVLGSAAIIGQYPAPFMGFSALAKKYGDVYSIRIGQGQCLVVSSLELIREVLNQNGRYFGGRPDFLRYHQLFGGDRNNCKYHSLIESSFPVHESLTPRFHDRSRRCTSLSLSVDSFERQSAVCHELVSSLRCTFSRGPVKSSSLSFNS